MAVDSLKELFIADILPDRKLKCVLARSVRVCSLLLTDIGQGVP
jgi:hypothetical protein